MISVLQTFPDYVAGFRCDGRVTRRDYDEILIPHVERTLATEGKVRLYYETSADFSIAPGAMWEDFRIGFGHLRRWERIAVVTDIEWLNHTIRAFGFLLPGRVRVFTGSEVERARAWIVADPAN